jgi:hypothetical protein
MKMGYEFDAPEEATSQTGGNYLVSPGTYHCVISGLNDGQGPKGNSIDGFTVELTVLAGAQDDSVGKVHTETFFSPKLNAKDGGKFGRQQLFAFFVAAGLARPDQLGSRLSIDLDAAVNRQVVVQLEVDTYARDKNPNSSAIFLRLKGCNIYHPDDPRCENAVKDPEMIAMMESTQRHPPEYFGPLTVKRQKVGTPGAAVDVSDL